VYNSDDMVDCKNVFWTAKIINCFLAFDITALIIYGVVWCKVIAKLKKETPSETLKQFKKRAEELEAVNEKYKAKITKLEKQVEA